jgi:S1-C subfamily serine protease
VDVVQPYPPPSPPQFPQEPPNFAPRAGRSPRWVVVLAVALVLLVVGALAFSWSQAHRLTSTRTQLGALRASAAAEQAQLSALATTVDAQQKTLADLGSQLGATQTQLATTQSKLGTTQSQLQTAQTRLGTDEQQLNTTTKQLNVTTKQLPPDLVALATQVSPSVVLITCTTGGGGDTGTGFAIALPAAAGYGTTVITAEHVIDACTNPLNGAISLARGGQTLPVHLRSYDSRQDVAILDTTAKLPTLKPAAAPVVGEFLMAVGNPLGVNDNVTSGNVSQVYASYFLDSAPISNGSSGGPVVDRSGNVVGIVDAGAVADANTPVVENLNIALRLLRLCPTVLSGSSCAALH